MRSLSVTLVVCAAVGGASLATAWGLQAAVIPPPTQNARIAATATAWFLRHRLVAATVRVGNGNAVHSECVSGWFRTGRGTVLRFRNGVGIVAVRPHHVDVVGRRATSGPLTLLQLLAAGCPRVVGPRIGAAIQSVPHVRIDEAVVDGRRVLALHVPTRLARIVVYLSPLTYRPTAVWAESGELTAFGRLRFEWLTPARLRRISGSV